MEENSKPRSVLDSLGEEIVRIITPVSICMLLVVILVSVLNNDSDSSGPSFNSIATVAYDESSSDSNWDKLKGALLNAFVFVVVVTAVTFLLVLLFYFRCTKFLKYYMGFSSFLVLGFMGGEISIFLIGKFRIPIDSITFALSLFNFTVVGVLAVFMSKTAIIVTQGYLVVIGVLVAYWFTLLPEWTTWVLLVAMALYDLAAVLLPGGPLRLLVELAMSRDEDIPALVYEARPIINPDSLQRGAVVRRRVWRERRDNDFGSDENLDSRSNLNSTVNSSLESSSGLERLPSIGSDEGVIQRKMAYVIGLPLSLADEDLLQRKEYFGQYGKVTKISLSRTTGGAIQQFVNDTCSVYITYSKEEEAVRCIQAVHGFILEDRYLRASFGTAKYCHAWLRNTPCSNPSCLYLHSIGADEDSFGKDDVAAIHTRNRVQQIVGATSNMMNCSGNVLPPPIDELSSSGFTLTETTSIRNAASDASNDTMNHSSYMTHVIPHDKDGDAGGPNRMTTFVDIVGRHNTSGAERDGNSTEDCRILNLSSDLSSVTISKDNHDHETFPDKTLSKVPSSNHVVNHLQGNQNFFEFSNEPYREDYTSSDSQGPKDSNNMDQKPFLMPSCPAQSKENYGDHLLVHMPCSLSSNGVDYGALHNQVDEASLPLSCVNAILNEGFHDLKFQNSVKSDRVYRSSTSFSNEEIVEHLRRIDGDNLNNYQDSSFNTIENSIISNMMSKDLDSCDDSMALRCSFVGSYGESVGKHGVSWNSLHNDPSGFSFAKQEDFSRQGSDLESCFRNIGQIPKNSSLFQDFRENKEQYVHKAPYQIGRPKVSAPPGFSMPSRDLPHGFASSDDTGGIPRALSASRLVNSSSSSLLHTPSTGSISSAGDIDFVEPAISGFGNGKPTNGFDISALEIGSACVPPRRGFEDEARIWHLMQQKSLDQGKFSQRIASQTPSVHQSRRFPSHGGDEYFGLDDIYGFSSRVMDQHQNFDPPSYSQFPQQKLVTNGHIFNGFQHNSLDDIHRTIEVDSMTQHQTANETLGFKKLYAGYGDVMFQVPRSGDVYTRVFGM